MTGNCQEEIFLILTVLLTVTPMPSVAYSSRILTDLRKKNILLVLMKFLNEIYVIKGSLQLFEYFAQKKIVGMTTTWKILESGIA